MSSGFKKGDDNEKKYTDAYFGTYGGNAYVQRLRQQE